MEVFNTLFVISLGSYIHEEDRFDMLKKLPVEIAIMILRKLDGAALINASRVNKYWHNICMADKMLKSKIRQYLKEKKIKRQRFILGDTGRFDYVPKSEAGVFKNKNIRQPSNGNETVVTNILTNSTIRSVPMVVLQSKGIKMDVQDPRGEKRKTVADMKNDKGIPKAKKRRLLRL